MLRVKDMRVRRRNKRGGMGRGIKKRREKGRTGRIDSDYTSRIAAYKYCTRREGGGKGRKIDRRMDKRYIYQEVLERQKMRI